MRKRVKEMLLHKAQRVIDTFNEWDKDHSLTVDIEEFRGAMGALGVTDPNEIHTLWEVLDADGTGEIAYHELLAAVDPHRAAPGKASLEALDPNNKQHRWKYGHHEAESAGRDIERNGIRDVGYNEDVRVKSEVAERVFQQGLRNDAVDPNAKFKPKQRPVAHLPGLAEHMGQAGVASFRDGLREALQSMATTRVIDVFRSWDVDDCGTVSYKEFAAAVTTMGVKASSEEMHEMFAQFDTDGNGSIDYKELEKALKPTGRHQEKGTKAFVPPPSNVPAVGRHAQPVKAPASPASKAKKSKLSQLGLGGSQLDGLAMLRDVVCHKASRVLETFKEWDSDRSGTITYKEFSKAMVGMGITVGENVQELWNTIDADGTGEIAYHELLAALNPRAAASGATEDALDPNNQRKAFKYGKQQADAAAKLIERDSGIRDEDFETAEKRRNLARNPDFFRRR